MLRKAWQDDRPEGLSVIWQYRKNPPDDGVIWYPGAHLAERVPRVESILALWGVTPASSSDLAGNRQLALDALDLALRLGAKRVLHCSSSAVYAPSEGRLDESRAGGAITAYGAAKLEMERAIADWTAQHPGGPRSCIMRIANVVGADSLFAALDRGKARITLDRFADGEGPWRSYITMQSLARVFTHLLSCPLSALPPVVNVASPEPLAMAALVRAAGRGITWRAAPDNAVQRVVLDTRTLSGLLPLPSLSADRMIADWHALRQAP